VGWDCVWVERDVFGLNGRLGQDVAYALIPKLMDNHVRTHGQPPKTRETTRRAHGSTHTRTVKRKRRTDRVKRHLRYRDPPL